MFNLLTRGVGIVALGGAAVFAGYSLTRGDDDKQPAPAPSAAIETDASQADRPLNRPETDDLRTGAKSTDAAFDDDLLSTDPVQRDETPNDLAALGAGGILGDDMTADQVRQELGQSVSDASDTVIGASNRTIETAADSAQATTDAVGATTRETLDRLRAQAATTATDAGDDANAAVASTGLRGLPIRQASSGVNTDDSESTPEASVATAAAAATAAEPSAPSPEPQPAAVTTRDELIPTDSAAPQASAGTDAAATTARRVATASAAAAPEMTVPAAQRPGFTRNETPTDKSDNSSSFAANTARADKPDDGAYFTTDASGPATDPCVKSDGTPYIGPGNALNPFAAASPCLPKATAEGFDVAVNDPPLAIASDVVTDVPDTTSTQPITIRYPIEPVFISDYHSL